jgi:uncharacterized protein YbjT (DUF2867 family)
MILVTGATGKNGVEIIRRLSGRKEPVRAMVHRRNDILCGTPNVELEYFEADFDDPASLRKILSGVQRAFLVTNSSEYVEERSRNCMPHLIPHFAFCATMPRPRRPCAGQE